MVDARVALLVIVGASCAPRAQPAKPLRALSVPSRRAPEVPPQSEVPGPRYLVGEVCLNAALRGPHYFPLFAGGDIQWTAEERRARTPMMEGPQHFNVLGFDGERHGDMVTAPDGVTSDPRGFVGDYRGVKSTGPCSFVRPDGTRVIMMDCGNAGGCGIAIAVEARTSPPPAPPDIEHSATKLCIAGGALIGDLDGDGADEAFPIEGFRDQDAIQGVPHAGAGCTAKFTWYRVAVGNDFLDVLGAADLDQDGRLELLIAFTTAAGWRSVALYTPALAPELRLDRRAVATR
jgi:hypothetical protein